MIEKAKFKVKYDERYIVKAKKESSLVSGIRPGENLFTTHPPASLVCIRIYFFNLKKAKKASETKEEKRISVKNLTRYGDFFCEFALCTLTCLIQSWISPACYMNLI